MRFAGNSIEMMGSIPVPPLKKKMTEKEIYDLYVLQSKNVRKLKQVERNLIRTINTYIKKNDNFQVELNTKLYALVYSTLSEAQFIQIVNTPNLTQLEKYLAKSSSWSIEKRIKTLRPIKKNISA